MAGNIPDNTDWDLLLVAASPYQASIDFCSAADPPSSSKQFPTLAVQSSYIHFNLIHEKVQQWTVSWVSGIGGGLNNTSRVRKQVAYIPTLVIIEFVAAGGSIDGGKSAKMGLHGRYCNVTVSEQMVPQPNKAELASL